MLIQSTMLSDSLTIRSITTDKFKTGTITLSMRYEDDPMAMPYSLLLCELLKNCTASYPTKVSFARRLDELYSASISPRCILQGSNRMFTFNAEMLDNAYATEDVDIAAEVCSLLCDVALSPLLDDDGFFPSLAFEQEKRRVISYLRSIINNPAKYALQKLYSLTMRHDASYLDLDKKMKAVEDCDRETLTKYYKEKILSRPIDVFYVGTLTHDEIKERIIARLGSHKASVISAPSPLTPKFEKREVAYLDEEMPINQGRLAIGFRTDVCGIDKDGKNGYYAMALANEIYGGGAASKLFMNVREKLGLCYSCYSSYDYSRGEMTVASGIDPADREVAQNAIFAELEEMKKGNISEKEFDAAKKAIENYYREIYDHPYGMISYYLHRLPIGIDVDIEECRRGISAVTLDEVIEASRKIEPDAVYFLSGSGAEDEGETLDGDDDE